MTIVHASDARSVQQSLSLHRRRPAPSPFSERTDRCSPLSTSCARPVRYAELPQAADGTDRRMSTGHGRPVFPLSFSVSLKTKIFSLNFGKNDYICTEILELRNGKRQFSQDVGFPRENPRRRKVSTPPGALDFLATSCPLQGARPLALLAASIRLTGAPAVPPVLPDNKNTPSLW